MPSAALALPGNSFLSRNVHLGCNPLIVPGASHARVHSFAHFLSPWYFFQDSTFKSSKVPLWTYIISLIYFLWNREFPCANCFLTFPETLTYFRECPDTCLSTYYVLIILPGMEVTIVHKTVACSACSHRVCKRPNLSVTMALQGGYYCHFIEEDWVSKWSFS